MPGNAHDHALITRAVSGDRVAIGSLLERYGRRLYGQCIASTDDADDCYQEIWARVLTALPRFDPSGTASLGTWIHRVAHNYLIDHHRKQKVRRVVVPLEQEPGVEATQGSAVERQLRRKQLQEALAKLPPAQRRAVVAHYIDELSVKDVAKLEGVPEGTVKSRLHHGRAKLMTHLGGAP